MSGLAFAERPPAGEAAGLLVLHHGRGADRPPPAGILAFSGFVPVVDGWHPELASRPHVCTLITHGRNDPVMGVAFARQAVQLLQDGGLDPRYLESDAAHHIDPAHLPEATEWIAKTLGLKQPVR